MTRSVAKGRPPLEFRDVAAGAPERARRWAATFSGDAVSVHDIDIPPAIRGAERMKAARIMLSDRVAQDPDALAILPLSADPRARVWNRVAVVDRAVLDRIRDRCAPGCVALLPDFLALPYADGVAVLDIAAAPGLYRMRVGADFGCTAEAPFLTEVLETLATERAVDRIRIAPEVPPAVAAQFVAVGLAPMDVADLTPVDDALARTQDMGAEAGAGSDPLGPWIRRNWAPLVALYAALIVAGVGLFLRAGGQEAAAADIRDRATDLARATFLPDGPILDLRQQVTRAIAVADSTGATGLDTDFTPGLALMSSRLTTEGTKVDRIAWGAGEGYVIELTVRSFADLQALTADLESLGFAVAVAGSRVLAADSVGATLRLSRTLGAE